MPKFTVTTPYCDIQRIQHIVEAGTPEEAEEIARKLDREAGTVIETKLSTGRPVVLSYCEAGSDLTLDEIG